MGRAGRCGGEARNGRGGRRARALCVGIVALCMLAVTPAAACAQANPPDELSVLGVNALLGGVTSGMTALVQGRSFFRAFGLGLAGGTLAYGGKRVVSWHGIPGSGLAGRFFASVGASLVRNGAAGRGPFDLVLLPLGPLTLYLRPPDDSTHAPIKLNLARTALLAVLVAHDDFRVDWRASLHAGAPVFDLRDEVLSWRRGRVTLGMAVGGSVMLSDLEGRRIRTARGELIAHERVHVLQDDFAEIAWAGPIEGWLLGHLPGGAWLRRYVDLGLLEVSAVALALWAVPAERAPWEREADYLETAWDVGL